MPKRTDSIERIRQRRDALRVQLSAVGDMRPGSLVERYRRCGKKNCHCAQESAAGHGPSFSLTHAVKGKTVTRVIPIEAVEITRDQIAEYHRFREVGQELIEANEQLCDAQLRMEDPAANEEVAEKRGSKRRFRARSGSKSKI